MSDSKIPKDDEFSDQDEIGSDDNHLAVHRAERGDQAAARPDGKYKDDAREYTNDDINSLGLKDGVFGGLDSAVGAIADPDEEFRQPIEMYPRRGVPETTEPTDPVADEDASLTADNLTTEELAFDVSPHIRKTGDPLYAHSDSDLDDAEIGELQLEEEDEPIPMRGGRFKPPSDGRRFGGLADDNTRPARTPPDIKLVPKSRRGAAKLNGGNAGSGISLKSRVTRDRLTAEEIQHESERTRADIVALRLQTQHFGLDKRLADARMTSDAKIEDTELASLEFNGETIDPLEPGVAPKEPPHEFVPVPAPNEIDMTPPSESDRAVEYAADGLGARISDGSVNDDLNIEPDVTATAVQAEASDQIDAYDEIEIDDFGSEFETHEDEYSDQFDEQKQSEVSALDDDHRTDRHGKRPIPESVVAQVEELFGEDYGFDEVPESEIRGNLSPTDDLDAADLYDDDEFDDDDREYANQDRRGTAQKSVFEIDAPVEKETLRVEPTTPASFKTMRNLVSERVHRHARKRRSDEQELEREVSGYRMKRSMRWVALGGTGAVILLLAGGYMALDEPIVERKPGIRDILANMPPTNPNTDEAASKDTVVNGESTVSESVIVPVESPSIEDTVSIEGVGQTLANETAGQQLPLEPIADSTSIASLENRVDSPAAPDAEVVLDSGNDVAQDEVQGLDSDAAQSSDGVTTESGLLDTNVVITEEINPTPSNAESAPLSVPGSSLDSTTDVALADQVVDREKRLADLLERVNQTIAEQKISDVEQTDPNSSDQSTIVQSESDTSTTIGDDAPVSNPDQQLSTEPEIAAVEDILVETPVQPVETSDDLDSVVTETDASRSDIASDSISDNADPRVDTVAGSDAPTTEASVSSPDVSEVQVSLAASEETLSSGQSSIALNDSEVDRAIDSETNPTIGSDQLAAVMLPGTEIAKPEETANADSSDTAEEAARKRNSIRAQLDVVRDQIDSLRLTTPVGDNAFESISGILATEPDNVDALTALNEIRSRYLQWADRAVEDGELEKAIVNYRKVISVDPGRSETVQQIVAELEQQRDAVSLTNAANAQAVRGSDQDDASYSENSEESLQTAALKPSESSSMLRAREKLDELGIEVTIRNLVDLTNEGDYDAVDLLLEAGLSVDSRAGQYGFSPLIVTAIRGDTGMLKLLLDNEVDIDGRSSDGRTALMAAAWNGHQFIVDTLLDNRASVQIANADGWTALHYAAWQGHSDIVRTLLEKGADPSVRNGDGWTVSETAEKKGFIQILEIIEQSARGQG